MAKKLFKNYSFELDSNERKVLSNFCKKAIQQMSGDERFNADVKNFESILQKLGEPNDVVKLTKAEKTKLVLQLRENTKFIKESMKKSWFIKKWLYKTMYNQYNNLLVNHFED